MLNLSDRVLLSIMLVVSGVGVLDAFISREWDLLAVFAVQSALVLVIWARQRASRTPATLRSDLADWLEEEAQRTGESIDALLDRSVAWRRSELFDQDAGR